VTIGKGGEVAGVMTGGTINGDVTFGVTGWASPSYPIFESGTINGNVTFESGSIMVGGTITGNTTWNGFTGQYSKPGASYDGKYFAGGHLRQPEDGQVGGAYYINGELANGSWAGPGYNFYYLNGEQIGSVDYDPDINYYVLTFTTTPSSSFSYSGDLFSFVFPSGTALPAGATIQTSRSVSFADGSYNSGSVTVTGSGTVTFNGNSYNSGTINGAVTLNDDSYNSGTVNGSISYTACAGDCYLEGTSPNYAQGLGIGTRRQGPAGTALTLQYASGSSGFKIWKEENGTRILNATGLVANGWQKMLTRAGTAFSSATDNTQYFTSGSNIAGRVCPSEVFIDRAHPLESNRCLYFTPRNSQIALNASSTGGIYGEDYLEDPRDSSSGNGNNVSWYEGNIKACADKGMRLPVLYEVSNIDPGSSWRPTDWNPSFSSSEVVPSSVLFDENIEAGRCSWSATGTTTENNAGYISAGGANVDCPWPMWYDEQEYNNALVCVLPSH
jgi:hypothetical protein